MAGGVILIFSFPDNIFFVEKLHFNLYTISLPAIKGMVCFKRKLTLSKTIEYLLMQLITLKGGEFSMLHLCEVVSSTF